MTKENTGNPLLDLSQDMHDKAKKLENKPSTALTPQNKVEQMFQVRGDIFTDILPAHLTKEKLMRYTLMSYKKLPKLLECDIGSMFGAILECAQLGLEPHTALGQAYILPFYNTKKAKHYATFVVGYKGLVELFYRTGQIASIRATEVYDKDEFDYDNGTDFITHRPYQGDYADRGPITHYYARIKFINGGSCFEVMTASQMDWHKIKYCPSAKYSTSAWQTDPAAMGAKTVLKKLGKYVPKSQELVRVVYSDEQIKLDTFAKPMPEQEGELVDIPNAEEDVNG